MADNHPSGTVTFLFTDIEGSMKIAREHRDAWESLRGRHDAILRAAMESHGGHVFQVIGDAFCAAFRTAEDALAAAVAAQRALQSEPWAEARLKVRMGLHTGTAQVSGEVDATGGYTGYSAMARTQRVMSTAYGEQILLSVTSADLLSGELPAGVMLRDMGQHRLKGLINPEHLWQVVAAGLVQDFPALQTLDSIPNNLPLQLTSFIGREKEVGEIKALMEKSRLVTLTGSGGVGKTRHALQVAAEMLDAYEDGAWLIELGKVSDAGAVVSAVASTLGVREDPSQPLMKSVQDHLRAKKTLLILDNCEHLLDECARAADALLHACPHVTILVTSQEALGMSGEVAYRVPSLALPDLQQLPSPAALSQFDSVRLFIERAVAVKPEFEVSNENAPAVAQICARLDGIPLAIELAAARVKGLSPGQIASRLDDRFRLLTAGSRTALPRHQTLRAMIEWSYDLLSESGRALLRRLSVFSGDWSLEAAESVCADATRSGTPPSEVPGATGAVPIGTEEILDLLLHLVDKSLVVPEERAGQARYRLLETIAQFAAEKLSESGEAQAVRRRHLEYFLKFSEDAAPKLEGAQRWQWVQQSGAEYENLRAALEWARTSGVAPDETRMADATEQLGDIQLLLAPSKKALPLYLEALRLCEQAMTTDAWKLAGLHAKVLQTAANLHMYVDLTEFKALCRDAGQHRTALLAHLTATEGEPPRRERVRLLTALAADARQIREPRDVELAEEYGLAAIELAERLGSPVELAAALTALNWVLFLRGKWRELAELTKRRLDLHRQVLADDALEGASVLLDAAQALERVGDYSEALLHAFRAREMASQAKLPDIEKGALDETAHCLMALDRWDEVLGLDATLRDMRRRYTREFIGPSCYAISVVARIHGLRGEVDLARRGRQEADAIMTETFGSHDAWTQFQHF